MQVDALTIRGLLDVLRDDERACLATIRREVGPCSETIPLLLGPLEPEEALAWARTLLELGREAEAEELLGAVLADAIGGPTALRPLGSQRPRAASAQGPQHR